MCLAHGPHPSLPPAPKAAGSALSRRRFMVALVGVSGTVLVAGCDETGIGLNLVPEEQVRQLSLESWQRIKADTRRSDNARYQQIADRVAADILRAGGEDPGAWEVVVFEGEEANAFALPGGKIGVFEGMFRYAENEDQLAAVIGHEIGHNQAEHAHERLSTQAATDVGLQLISTALQLGNIGYANEIAALLGAGAQYGVILPYGRSQELEADKIGLRNMAQAGYDPRASIELWQNMKRAGATPPGFLSTHPAPDARIEALRELMPQALEIYQGA